MPKSNLSTGVLRAGQLLDCLIEHESLKLADFVAIVNENRSVVYRTLRSLVEIGLLSYDPDTRHYFLGNKLLQLGTLVADRNDAVACARKLFPDLVRTTGQTAVLTVLRDNKLICMEVLEAPGRVKIVSEVGRKLPLYSGAASKVVLAYLPADRLEHILATIQTENITPNTPTLGQLRRELVVIREQGYATSIGENDLRLSAVAAPIFDHTGTVIGSVAISGLVESFVNKFEEFGHGVRGCADKISKYLGYDLVAEEDSP